METALDLFSLPLTNKLHDGIDRYCHHQSAAIESIVSDADLKAQLEILQGRGKAEIFVKTTDEAIVKSLLCEDKEYCSDALCKNGLEGAHAPSPLASTLTPPPTYPLPSTSSPPTRPSQRATVAALDHQQAAAETALMTSGSASAQTALPSLSSLSSSSPSLSSLSSSSSTLPSASLLPSLPSSLNSSSSSTRKPRKKKPRKSRIKKYTRITSVHVNACDVDDNKINKYSADNKHNTCSSIQDASSDDHSKDTFETHSCQSAGRMVHDSEKKDEYNYHSDGNVHSCRDDHYHYCMHSYYDSNNQYYYCNEYEDEMHSHPRLNINLDVLSPLTHNNVVGSDSHSGRTSNRSRRCSWCFMGDTNNSMDTADLMDNRSISSSSGNSSSCPDCSSHHESHSWHGIYDSSMNNIFENFRTNSGIRSALTKIMEKFNFDSVDSESDNDGIHFATKRRRWAEANKHNVYIHNNPIHTPYHKRNDDCVYEDKMINDDFDVIIKCQEDEENQLAHIIEKAVAEVLLTARGSNEESERFNITHGRAVKTLTSCYNSVHNNNNSIVDNTNNRIVKNNVDDNNDNSNYIDTSIWNDDDTITSAIGAANTKSDIIKKAMTEDDNNALTVKGPINLRFHKYENDAHEDASKEITGPLKSISKNSSNTHPAANNLSCSKVNSRITSSCNSSIMTEYDIEDPKNHEDFNYHYCYEFDGDLCTAATPRLSMNSMESSSCVNTYINEAILNWKAETTTIPSSSSTSSSLVSLPPFQSLLSASAPEFKFTATAAPKKSSLLLSTPRSSSSASSLDSATDYTSNNNDYGELQGNTNKARFIISNETHFPRLQRHHYNPCYKAHSHRHHHYRAIPYNNHHASTQNFYHRFQ